MGFIAYGIYSNSQNLQNFGGKNEKKGNYMKSSQRQVGLRVPNF